MAGNPQNLPTENIDGVILRLLALEPNEVDELDYESYRQYLKELLVEIAAERRKIGSDEFKNIRDEFKRVKGKKGRFRIVSKKTKITSNSFGIGRVKNNVVEKQKKLILAPVGGVKKQSKGNQGKEENVEKVSKPKTDPIIIALQRIIKNLDSIIKTLSNINKENSKRYNIERKSAETKKRKSKENELESSKFGDGIKKAISTIVKPFQSIWDKIINFIGNIILGRILINIINWIGDEKNQGKIQSIIRFFSDHWPLLLALYLRFGTGIGKFIGKLSGVLIKGAIKLAGLAAKLAAKVGLKGAGKFASFLGGPKGKLLGAGLTVAANVAGVMATSGFIKDFAGGGEDKTNQEDLKGPNPSEAVQKYAGGGLSGGFKNFFGNAFSGMVRGPGGSKGDKIPAMLSNGEFVMSAGAVQKYGVDTLESMNAAGGGTNIPQIANGIVRAAGGGYVGDVRAAQDAWINYMNANPEKFNKTGVYGTAESTSNATKDFLKTFMKTGQPPEWAKVTQKTTKVNAPPNQESYSQKPPKSPGQNTQYSQTQSSRSTRPNTSSSSISRQTSALSTNVRPPVQRINTNMNVPGGRIRGGSLSAILAAFEMKQRKDEGQTNLQAGLGAGGSAIGGQLGWMAGVKTGAIAGAALGSVVPGLGTGVGAAVGAVVGGLAGGFGGASLGGKLADDLSGVNSAKERASRGVGGKVVGGWGLKGQSFKDAPKTSIITDDKGRPSVGFKALKNGQLTYVRRSAPGTGTRNPLEMLGRFINPNAYKDNDAKIGRRHHKEAMVNALESMQSQGMAPDAQARMMKQMGGNLKDVQNDLRYRNKTKKQQSDEQKRLMTGGDKGAVMRRNNAARIARSQSSAKPPVKPLPRSKPKPYVPAGGGMNGRRGSGSNPSVRGSKTRSQNPSPGSSSTRLARSTLGIK
jgi:hypothetical protein